MKKFLLVFITLTLASVLRAQSYKFNGDWKGKITSGSGSSLWVRITIDNYKVTQYYYDSDEDTWNPVSPVIARYSSNKNNFLYYWMNNSTIWSETQTYALSYINEDKLYVVWSRQVNNIQEDEDNEVWSVQGSGYLTRN